MANSNVTGKVIGAIIVGTLVGATLGILFAPYKGSRTRNRIARRAKDLTHDLSKKMKEEATALLNKAEEFENMAEQKIHDLTDKVKQKADSYKYQDTKNETNNL
jgi:gas vesicle protein